MQSNAVNKYKKTFHNGDWNEIFRLLVENYEIKSAIYPGSYIHIAPSFHIHLTFYIDTYKKTKDYFNDRDIYDYFYKNRTYKEQPIIRFHHANYTSNFGEKLRNFDLLISLYAGFVSQSCKEYLKVGGILLTNNSHGNASMAYIDDDYQFICWKIK